MKKFISCLLVFAMICSPSLTVFASEKISSHLDYNLSEEDIEHLITTPEDIEIREQKLNYVPEEILKLPTKELLKYFLGSPKMAARYIISNPELEAYIDYKGNMAFDELISREDFVQVVNAYGKELYSRAITEENEVNLSAYKSFIINKDVEPILSATSASVLSIDSQQAYIYEPSYFYVGYIRYKSYSTTNTISNQEVTLYKAERALNQSELNQIDAYINSFSNLIEIYGPNEKYNCYSYACYQPSSVNPYWIYTPEAYITDPVSTRIQAGNIESGDIIIYYSLVNNVRTIVHAGIVLGFSEQGEIIICSKWGQSGVYYHSIGNVPSAYKLNGSLDVEYYRYHNYERISTGNNYHSGGRHFYEYADECTICGKITNASWTAVLCPGPPCNIITRQRALKIK